MTQLSFDSLSRGTSAKGPCKYLHRDSCAGMVVEEGLVILGRCDLLGGTAYDRRCETCLEWRSRA